MSQYPTLKGFDSEDAEWNLDLSLEQVATIFALMGWPLANGVATPERIEKVIDDLVKAMNNDKYLYASYGRLSVRRNPGALNCVELAFDIGHLDFTEAIEERAKGGANGS
ncbi:hypothetical protein [Kitasatospora mediocidica]|uniref:hypothetical protein n=1 Tax=Kitasatospora mediocidica TaxID=58352 RepID=UPI00055DE8BE|nr:hypothetical protein [Kitasatospora mediocidica]